MGYRLGTYKPCISFLIRFPEPLNKTAELVIPPTLVMPVPSTVRLKPPLLKAEKPGGKSLAEKAWLPISSAGAIRRHGLSLLSPNRPGIRSNLRVEFFQTGGEGGDFLRVLGGKVL